MATSEVKYLKDLRTECIHLKSSQSIVTDAPTDNHGKGEAFSPTDLAATSLATCMLTVMGIKGNTLGIKLDGSRAFVTKIMASAPRRISRIEIEMHLPNIAEAHRQVLEETAENCPVAKSLHPDLEVAVNFHWNSNEINS